MYKSNLPRLETSQDEAHVSETNATEDFALETTRC